MSGGGARTMRTLYCGCLRRACSAWPWHGRCRAARVASKATVDALRDVFTASEDAPFAVTAAAAAQLASRALNRASQWIKVRSDERGLNGTGSTVVMLLFDRVMPEQALVLHAGDSRAYRYRKGKLQQLSADHSVAVAAGLADDKKCPRCSGA